MTSRDLTENVEQLQVRDALVLVRARMVTVLVRLAERAAEHATTVITGRSHNVPAQATTLGKRFANAGQELLVALRRVDELIARYPLRGIKGPVGTQQDMLDLLATPEAVVELEQAVARHLGFDAWLDNVGQVYPRSLDLDVVAGAGAGGRRSFEPGHHAAAHGRPGTGDRGVQGRPGGLVGHAPQDELAVVRAGLRLRRDLVGSPHHGHGPLRRAVERGRRVRLGGAPGGAARRLLRPRRPVRDLPHRARRVRRVPRDHRPGERALPARSWSPPRSSWLPCVLGWAERSPTRPSRSPPSRPHWPCARAPRTTWWTASPPTSAWAWTEAIDAAIANPLDLVGLAPSQVNAFVAAVQVLADPDPAAAAYRPGDIL